MGDKRVETVGSKIQFLSILYPFSPFLELALGLLFQIQKKMGSAYSRGEGTLSRGALI